MGHTIKSVVAAVLWTASVAILGVGTLRGVETVMEWGLFIALVAVIVNCWVIGECVVRRDRVHVQSLVEAVVDRLTAESGVPRL